MTHELIAADCDCNNEMLPIASPLGEQHYSSSGCINLPSIDCAADRQHVALAGERHPLTKTVGSAVKTEALEVTVFASTEFPVQEVYCSPTQTGTCTCASQNLSITNQERDEARVELK